MSFDVVLAAPAPPSLAVERQEEMQRQKTSWLRSADAEDQDCFRVLSYNMLADSYRLELLSPQVVS